MLPTTTLALKLKSAKLWAMLPLLVVDDDTKKPQGGACMDTN